MTNASRSVRKQLKLVENIVPTSNLLQSELLFTRRILCLLCNNFIWQTAVVWQVNAFFTCDCMFCIIHTLGYYTHFEESRIFSNIF